MKYIKQLTDKIYLIDLIDYEWWFNNLSIYKY